MKRSYFIRGPSAMLSADHNESSVNAMADNTPSAVATSSVTRSAAIAGRLGARANTT